MTDPSTDIRGTLLTVPDERKPTHGLLPDPPQQELRYTVLSVDDHLVEPPGMFEGRLPDRLAGGAPKVITLDSGEQAWTFDGVLYRQVGLNAVAGRPREDWSLQSTTSDEMRRGCWDIHERIKDMDLAGIWAQVNFPSQVTGFCGSVFSRCHDPELGLATTRAWNDWFAEEWWAPYPHRSVPMGITWLADPEIGAQEIRRNAARGFRAVTLPERPHKIGLPSVSSGYWDPILSACQETGTVVCLHVGSSGVGDVAPDAPMLQVVATLFSSLSLTATVEWLWSGAPVRFPDLKIVMSEGGIGWVPMLLDRLDYITDHSGSGLEEVWGCELRPSAVLQRNFWFCLLDDPSTLPIIDRIGVENILYETDYPHADSLWPAVQDWTEQLLGGQPVEAIRKITHGNAAALFRHPLPEVTLPAAEAAATPEPNSLAGQYR